ncbi:MAG: DNA polymerase III subunit alpha, partial [Pseudobutyrivibrio sp.]|nr:DNA polymerase III subunit alpha [Pseudobutyrivibrio sp.]
VRRAMSKKKHHVMEEERRNFVYGTEDGTVPGCVKNGIDEAVANKIYDDMIAFASYAFNKSHAAAYAVVALQTAYLKKYYPVEFMAALMTSVIDNTTKVAGYIGVCRSAGIDVLPPDVNAGGGRFSVQENKIRYGMYAIKSVGRPTIDAIVNDRQTYGPFKDIEDFVGRVSRYDANRRTIENLIKAGALDSLEGNRRQKCMIFPHILDNINSSKKNDVAGQMSLFDFVDEEQKKELRLSLPPVEEFEKEIMLSFEKELMGVYVSGHPLEDSIALLEKNATAKSSDFLVDEELGWATVEDGKDVVIGGIIESVAIKYTKNNKTMAFLTLEDLVGTVEVIVFPNDYEANKNSLTEGNKVFVQGRAQVEEEKDAKLICSSIRSFADCRKELWIQFKDKDTYMESEQRLMSLADTMPGEDSLVIYLTTEKQVRRMPAEYNLMCDDRSIEILSENFGEDNVKVVEKPLEFQRKSYRRR